MTEKQNSLYQQLVEEEAYVFSLIDTIPPKFYFDQETAEQLTDSLHASVDKKVEGRKRKQEAGVKSKHKVARLDPCFYKPVSQILQELHRNDNKKRKKAKQNQGVKLDIPSASRASSLGELRSRLNEKIGNLRGSRVILDENEKATKRKEKEELKKKKKKKKPKSNFQKGSEVNGIDSTEKKPQPQKEKPKPVFNKEGKMVFSKFEFDGCDQKDRKVATGKLNKKENLKKTLFKVKKDKEKLQRLEDQEPERAKEVKEKKLWLKALDQAEGVKLKDDPELLKKSIKKKEQLKKKSQKKWKVRTDFTEKHQKDRQEKRKRNIQARKKEKLDKKLKRAKKKGRLIGGV